MAAVSGSAKSLDDILALLLVVQPSVSKNRTLANNIQLENAYCSILVTLDGMLIHVNDQQSLNALLPRQDTVSGMLMLVKDEQPLNASSLILVNFEFSPNLTLVKELQP